MNSSQFELLSKYYSNDQIKVDKLNGVPIPVVARSLAWVCRRLLAGIAGSNRAGGMDICLL